MIDMHCHILPNVDDGANTLIDSLEMARWAVAEGIHTIIATPHHKNGKYVNERAEVIYKVERLNDELQRQNIPLKVLPGQEVRLYGNLLEEYESGKVMTLNGTNKYMLIEFPANHIPHYAEQLLYELKLKRITPVIAHPERNAEFRERPDKLYDIVKKGALTQVTAGSLIGKFGREINKFSLQLVEHNLTHVIASDAHNTTTRGFNLNKAYERIQEEFGANVMHGLKGAPALLISGQSIVKYEANRIQRKKLFGIF